jgi:hypothetical protein
MDGLLEFLSDLPDAYVSQGVGLWGVLLARWVFVNRENRRLTRPQRWQETMPLTLVAMLVTAVLVHDKELGISMAAFTGLGVGWVAVLLLDVLGDRILAAMRAGFAVPVPPNVAATADKSGEDGVVTSGLVEPDEGMAESLRALDDQPGVHKP